MTVGYHPTTSYGHSIARAGVFYLLTWTHARYHDGKRIEFPVRRVASRACAEKFAARWGIDMPAGALRTRVKDSPCARGADMGE